MQWRTNLFQEEKHGKETTFFVESGHSYLTDALIDEAGFEIHDSCPILSNSTLTTLNNSTISGSPTGRCIPGVRGVFLLDVTHINVRSLTAPTAT